MSSDFIPPPPPYNYGTVQPTNSLTNPFLSNGDFQSQWTPNVYNGAFQLNSNPNPNPNENLIKATIITSDNGPSFGALCLECLECCGRTAELLLCCCMCMECLSACQ